MNFITTDLAASLPHVRIMRNAFIPHAWKTDDVKKLLASIDRDSTKGKRDYAILLMIVHLGLRVSDIRNMKLSSLNWNRKTITLSVQKTRQALELPLLDDIGWAIIDYLKNGRPQTACDRLFVRHRAPFDSFGENASFYNELHRYMQVAGISSTCRWALRATFLEKHSCQKHAGSQNPASNYFRSFWTFKY